MRQKFAGLLCLILVAMMACSASAMAAAYTAGTYAASAPGIGGDVKVEVTFSDGAIESVVVTEHSETPGVSDPAIEQIPAAIVEHQSLGVDAVSGATITSGAILTAVADAVTQAGGDPEALKTAVEVTAEDASLEADVVVVGGGIAGLSAAIEAADAGASVILLEKKAATGGASALSGGECLAAGTQMQADEGIEDSWEALADYWVEKGEGKINEKMVRAIAEMAPANILWMKDNGVAFMDTLQTPTAMPWQNPKRTHKAANGGGTGFTEPLTASAEAKGVTILVNSPATGLIVEDGAVTGVTGTTATGGALSVKAGRVILATGGYENNAELMAEYSPSLGGLGSQMGDAHAGDGLLWARELGSPIVAGDSGIVLSLDYYSKVTQEFDPYGIYLYVNADGERFMDESSYWFRRSRLMLDQPGVMYYTIADAKAVEAGAALEAGIEAGAVVKADTIEGLAEQMGCEAAVLKATIDAYNEACAKGVDEAFGKAADKLTPVDAAPFYAVANKFNANSGSFGGPKIDETCKVLDASGSAIPGLYAAGEVANGEIFYREYPCSGSAIQSYMAMGRIAGRDAAEAVAQQ